MIFLMAAMLTAAGLAIIMPLSVAVRVPLIPYLAALAQPTSAGAYLKNVEARAEPSLQDGERRREPPVL